MSSRPLSFALWAALALTACQSTPRTAIENQLATKAMSLEGGVYQTAEGDYRLVETAQLDLWVSAMPLEEALNQSLACVDSDAATRVTYLGSPVPLGFVCAEALELLLRPKHITAGWPGYLAPHATTQALKEARLAWQDMLRHSPTGQAEP